MEKLSLDHKMSLVLKFHWENTLEQIQYVGIVITIKLIKKHVGKIHFSQFMGQHSKLILASVIAMSPMFVVSRFFDWHGPLALLLVMLVSTIGYFLVAKLLRVAEISMITGLLRSSRGKLSNKE